MEELITARSLSFHNLQSGKLPFILQTEMNNVKFAPEKKGGKKRQREKKIKNLMLLAPNQSIRPREKI